MHPKAAEAPPQNGAQHLAELRAGRSDHANLVAMRNNAGEGHYSRVALCDKLLKNKAWVTDPAGGGGNESTAIDRLEADCLGDITGAISLPELLELFRKFPSVAEWQRHKHNYKRMFAELRERERPRQVQRREFSVRRNDLTPPLSFPDLSPAEQKKEFSRSFDMVERYKERAEKAEKEAAHWKERAVKAEAELAKVQKKLERIEGIFAAKTA